MGKKKAPRPPSTAHPDLSLTLRPVPGKQDVWTNDELQLLDLGILLAHGFRLFYCLICGVCIPLDAIDTHLNESVPGHTPIHASPQTREAHANLFGYNVPLKAPHVSIETINWMPALREPKIGFRCNSCHKDDPEGFWRSATARNRHKTSKHKDLKTQLSGTPIYIQYFFPESYRSYNKFLPCVKYNPKVKLDKSNTLPDDEGKDRIFKSFLNALPPKNALQPTMPESTGVKDTNPFLAAVGWAKRVAGLDINNLIRAVDYPAEQDNDFKLIFPCKSLFLTQQKLIGEAYPSIRRKWMADSSSQVIFNPLGEAGVNAYTRRMVRLVVFVLRAARGLHISGKESSLDVYLTKEQKEAAEVVDAMLSHNHDGLQNAIQDLLVTVFAPSQNHHLKQNQFHDILQDFCMLAAIDRTGQFSEPKNITSPLAGVQYILRSVLLEKALKDSELEVGDADKSFDEIQRRYLTGNSISPYGGLQSLKAQVWTYAMTSTSLPNAQWANSECSRAIIKGKLVDLDELKRMVRQILADAEYLLYEELLFGIPLCDLGWIWSTGDTLIDKLGERKPGYSVFTEPANADYFAHLRESVLKAFHDNPKTYKHFYEDSGTSGEPTLCRDRVKAWLAKWEKLMGLTALLMHILGGQPPRSSELLCIYMQNLVHRFRHLYWFNDHFFYVVCLNKVTNITAKDRIIVHGLPPEMNQFLLVLNGIARHIAAAWSFHTSGEKAYHTQNEQMFNTAGTVLSSTKFSQLLQTRTGLVLDNPLGISDWRHLCVLITRKHFKLEPGEEQLEDEDENSRWDLQAGHGSKVAWKHYAIEAMEWHLMRDDTIAKYIKISAKISAWYLHTAQPNNPSSTNHTNRDCQKRKAKESRLERSDSDDCSDSDSHPLDTRVAPRDISKGGDNAAMADDDDTGYDSEDYVQPPSRSRAAIPTSSRGTRSQSKKFRVL